MVDWGDVSRALYGRLEASLAQLQKAWVAWQQYPSDPELARQAHLYSEQAQDIAAQTVAAHIAQEQYVVSFGISGPARSWQQPLPVGAWNGLNADQVRQAYIAAHKGDVNAAVEDWTANHQQGAAAYG